MNRLASLLDRAGVGINELDGRTGRYVFVNPKFCEIAGRSREELIGQSPSMLTHPDDQGRDAELMGQLRDGSISSCKLEKRYVRPDGSDVWVRLTVTGPSAEAETYLAVVEDITEQRRAVDALQASENQLRAIFESAPIGIAHVDLATFRFTRVNQALCAMTGYSAEELCEMSIRDITHPDDHAADAERKARSASGEAIAGRIEKRYVRKDGRIVWVVVNFRAMPDADGRAPHSIATMEDITPRRAAEAINRLQTSALQAAANAIVISDTNGSVQWVNAAFSQLTGYAPEEILGRNLSIVRSGVQDDAFYARMWGEISAGRTWQGDLVNRTKDGTFYREHMTITPVRDPEGTITHFIAIKEDVTERDIYATATARAEERHRMALDAAELGTWRFEHPDGRYHLDERARQHYGMSRPSVTREELLASVHPDDVARLRENIVAMNDPAGPGRVAIEYRVVLPGGDVRTLSVHGRAHFEGEGATRVPLFTMATSQDITESKHAATALRASEDRYRALIDNLDELVFSVDLEGTITFVSPSIRRLGYRAEQVIGQPMSAFVHPDDLPLAMQDFAARVAGTTSGPLENRWLDATGKARILRSTVRPLLIEGRLAGLTGLATDVTAQRETEEQLRSAQRMEAVGRLAGGVAHDFNNILSVILSYTEIAVADLREEDPLRADLIEVRDAGKRAEALTRQLLAFSRKQVLQPERVDLGALVGSLGKMLRRLIGEDVELGIAAAPGLYATRVDRGQIEQVVMNLAVNARDAMPDGGSLRIASANVTLEADAAAALEVEPGDYVELAVTDTGCGMDPAIAARVFEPFFTTKGVGKGTGLGLSMVHGMVKQSGGGVSVETAPGRGATFRVVLPRHVGAEEVTVSRAPPATAARGTETVLVVEDEAALRAVVKRVLSSAGYKVHVAANGGEALLLCEQFGKKLDLVLTDVIMPGMSGRQLSERLAPLCPSAKVIFMSGYTDDALEHHGVLAQRFLRKPFDRETLARRVRLVLDEA